MTPYQYALTAAALAACHLAVAQTQREPEIAGRASPPAVGASSAAPDSEPTVNQPRIIRGSDKVTAPAKPALVFEGPPVSLNFEEAPVAQVVRTVLGDILKVDYVLHPPLAGTVTLATRNPVSPDQAAFLLESALQANGLGLVRDGRGTYHVGRAEVLKTIGGTVRQAGGAPLPPGQGVVVVPLQFIGAAEMATILRPMMPAESLIRVDNLRNLLVLAGTRTQAEGWLDMINTFDVDLLKGMSVGVFPLKYASIQEVEAALALVGGGASSVAGLPAVAQAGRPGTGSASTPTPRAPTAAMGEGNPLFGALRIMPIERLNSILVVTPRAAYLDEARRWIERLDQPSDNGADAQLHIYKVQNGNARHLASVLSGIFGGIGGGSAAAGGTGVAPGLSTATGSSFGQGYPSNAFGSNTGTGFGGASGSRTSVPFGGAAASSMGGLAGRTTGQLGSAQGQPVSQGGQVVANIGNIRVMADELNNAILVWGTRAEYAKIEATIKRLDLPPTQVLIEASIVEVTLTDDLQYGLEWAFKDSPSSSSYTGAGTLYAGASGRSPLSALSNGFSYAVKNPAGTVTAMLRALSQKTSVKVIASPSLMVLDNHTASIAVGNQTPVLVGTTQNLDSNNTTQSYQYKDTGVNLMVTPSVNAGNLVSMQVDQSVTDVGSRDDVTGQRSFLQRQLSSKVAVRSGESIVMGGLIQDRSGTTKGGIPILHTLPLVGNLFGTTSIDGTRTELVVVITPRVVRTDIDIREVSEDLRDRLKGLKVFGLGDRAPEVPTQPQPSNVN